MKSTGCGSKQAVQDPNEAEDQDLRGEEELHRVTITKQEESREPDDCEPIVRTLVEGKCSGWTEETCMEMNHMKNKKIREEKKEKKRGFAILTKCNGFQVRSFREKDFPMSSSWWFKQIRF